MYYDPSVGRFTQMDTWMGNNSDPVSLHKYAYGNLNPISNIDPTGHFSIMSLMTSVNTASNLYTVASIGADLLMGNYAGAGMQVAEEIVYSKLGHYKPIAKLSPKAMKLFAKVFSKGVNLRLGRPASSTTLRHNMTQILGAAPAGHQAHHIVGASTEVGRLSRRKLSGLGIDVNSPSNGVFLPGCGRPEGIGVIHCGRHTRAYEEAVWDILQHSETKEHAINALSEIRRQLLSGELILNARSLN